MRAIYKSNLKMWKSLLESYNPYLQWRYKLYVCARAHRCIHAHPRGWGGRRVEKEREEVLYSWTTLTPIRQLHLRPALLLYPHNPTPVWRSFSLLTRNAPKSEKFSTNFHPCPHLIWKLEGRLLLSQIVNETLRGRKKPYSCWCIHASPLVVRFYF